MQEVAQTVEAELNQMTAEWREAEEEVRVLKEGLKQYNEDVNAAKSAAADIQQKLANNLQTKAVQARKKEKNGKEADSMSVEIEKLEVRPLLIQKHQSRMFLSSTSSWIVVCVLYGDQVAHAFMLTAQIVVRNGRDC